MRAIQKHLPHARNLEVHRVTVAAPPQRAWEAARHFDGATIPWVRRFFDLRELPARLSGRPVDGDRRLGVDQVIDSGDGFAVLEEVPGTEVVVGAIGQFWHLDIPFVKVAPAAFASFAEPGFGKVAWAIRVEPHGTGSQIAFEVRTTATDEPSWRRLSRYFGIIGPASRAIRAGVLAQLERELGALPRPEDRGRALPGDELVPAARHALTHGVDVEAPPALVWPWLMQLGCDRGGWYSIDALDNGNAPSLDRLEPAWTDRVRGDRLAATPAQDSFYDVLDVRPRELLAIGGEARRLGGRIRMSWSFVLEPLGGDATHLVTRVRADGEPRWSEWLQGAVIFPPVHALMERVQLRNLKRLAEREALARGPEAVC